MLSVSGIGKQYSNDIWGVREVTVDLEAGIHGLLGPNGAGKSTLLRMLTTVIKPTDGEIMWKGTDVIDDPMPLRRSLGYLPQDFGVYPDLTLEEFLEYVGALRSMDSESVDARIDELLELTNLLDVRDRKLDGFSGGMLQRAGIAQALLNDPELLVLDEPTVGLDPEERVRFRNVVSEMAADRIVILSTHIVPDIEATASRIALLNDGRLLGHTDPEDLIESVEGNVYQCTVPADELTTLRSENAVSGTVQRSDGVEVRVIADAPPTNDATSVRPTLEDAYLWRLDGEVR
jgi:ABC-type multidrug transport system, ATPase component